MRARSWIVVVVLVLMLALCGCGYSWDNIELEPVESGVVLDSELLVLAGRVIDGTGAAPRFDVGIVIRDGTIAEMLPLRQLEPDGDALILDARDATVLPGIINAHAHMPRWPGGRVWLTQGVTTVADLGAVCVMRLREEYDYPESPHLVAAGPIITVPEGYPIPIWGTAIAHVVSGPEDAASQVKELLTVQEVDVVKISVSSLGPTWPRLTVEEIMAIVEVAHSAGRTVIAHVDLETDFVWALQGGVDAMAHTPHGRVSDEYLQEAVDRGVVMISTLIAYDPWAETNPSVRKGMEDNLARFAAMGGLVAIGDDYGNPGVPPGLPLDEMLRVQQAAGLSAMDVLVAATRNPAVALGIDHQVGTLEPGKRADLLIVDGDPLEDLSDLRRVRWVVKGSTPPGD